MITRAISPGPDNHMVPGIIDRDGDEQPACPRAGDLAACAAAILNRSADVVGAVGVCGPDSRIKRKQLKLFSDHVVEAARSTSLALGYSAKAD